MAEVAQFAHKSHDTNNPDGVNDRSLPPGSSQNHYPETWGQAARDAYNKKAYEEPSANRTDSNPQYNVTDNSGTACNSPIKDGQAPTMTSGKTSRGCDFKDLQNSKDGKLDMPSIYDQAQKSTFHLEMHGKIGKDRIGATASGVAIDKEGDKCFVVTDNHAVGGANNAKMEHIWAQTDNKSFNAHTIWTDKAHDLALLSVDMRKNPQLCLPATISSHPDANGRAVGAGYPQDSNALTLSPAQLHGQAPMDEAVGRPDPKYKLQTDPHRKIIISDANTLEGQSGGGFWDKKSELAGLVGGGFPGVTNFTYVNPLNRKQIEDAIAKHHND